MRPTSTLEVEVARLIEAAMHRKRNAGSPFRVAAHRARLLPGINRMAFNRTADDLEDEAILSSAGRRRR